MKVTNRLKWKPPYENSIDFRLELRFPALESSPMKPDLAAKPQCRLMMNCGRDAEQLFDYLEVTDAQWDESAIFSFALLSGAKVKLFLTE